MEDSCNSFLQICEIIWIHASLTPSCSWLEFTNTCCDSFVQQQLRFGKPRHPGASCQISPFYHVPWRLTQSPKWPSASERSERLWKVIICETGGGERRLFALLFNIKGLRRFWAGERRRKEAIFDNLQWNLAVEDAQSLPGNARKLSEPEFRSEAPMWKSWRAASSESFSKTSHRPSFSHF